MFSHKCITLKYFEKHNQSPNRSCYINNFSKRLPVKILKLSEFALFIIILNLNLFQKLKLTAQSLSQNIAFFL